MASSNGNIRLIVEKPGHVNFHASFPLFVIDRLETFTIDTVNRAHVHWFIDHMPDFVANNVFAEKKNDLKNRRDFSIRCEIGLAAFTANTNGYKINIVETFVEHKFDQATSTNKLRSSLLAFVRAASNTDVAKSYQLPAPNVCMPIAKQQQNIRGLSEQEKNQEEAKGVPQFNFDDMVAADAETDLIF